MPEAKGSPKATSAATPTSPRKGTGSYQIPPSQPSSWHLQPGQSSPRGASRVEPSATSGVSHRSGHGLPSHKSSAFPATEAAAGRLHRSGAAEHAESQPSQAEPLVLRGSPAASTPQSQKRSPAMRIATRSDFHPRQQRHVSPRDNLSGEPAVSPFEFDLGTNPLASGNLTTPPRWGPAAQASSMSPQPTPVTMASSSSGMPLHSFTLYTPGTRRILILIACLWHSPLTAS